MGRCTTGKITQKGSSIIYDEFNDKMKRKLIVENKTKIIRTLKLSTLVFAGSILLIYIFISKCHTFNFSQDYHKVENWSDIVFRDHWSGQDFRRCIWGLKIADNYENFQEHREFDKNSYEYKTLSAKTDTHNITQIALSPDGKQILYAEHIYRGSGITDDEDVYYRVYNIEKDSIITIYAGHKEFLFIDWKR